MAKTMIMMGRQIAWIPIVAEILGLAGDVGRPPRQAGSVWMARTTITMGRPTARTQTVSRIFGSVRGVAESAIGLMLGMTQTKDRETELNV
jgi:hypothetical protein